MKFVSEGVCSKGGRLGKLSGLCYAPATQHVTPMILLTTQTASIPHLTQDVYEMLQSSSKQQEQELLAVAGGRLCCQPAPLLSVPVQHFAKRTSILNSYGKGVAAFAGLQGAGVVSSVQCSLTATPAGYNDRSSVSVWTHAGRVALRPEQYVECVSSLRCDWWEALHDADTPATCTQNRMHKSLAASWEHVGACLDLPRLQQDGGAVVLPLLGGWSVQQRGAWSKRLSQLHGQQLAHDTDAAIAAADADTTTKPDESHSSAAGDDHKSPTRRRRVGGYSLQGLHSNGATAERLEPTLPFLECVRASLSGTSSSLPRTALGSYSPHTLLALVGEGCDVFDSSLPCRAADRSAALTFAYTTDMLNRLQSSGEKTRESSPTDCDRQPHANADCQPLASSYCQPTANSHCRKKLKKENGCALATDKDNTEEHHQNDGEEERPYEINLKDKRHCGSTAPLLPGCLCYTCSNGYTRGYLHHLCSSGEMLVPLLLTMHNLHHWLGFFTSIRLSVSSDSLPELRDIVLNSYRPSSSHAPQQKTEASEREYEESSAPATNSTEQLNQR